MVLALIAGLLLARADAVSSARSNVTSDAQFLADRLGRDDVARTAFLWPRSGSAASARSVLDAFLDPRNAAQDVVGLTLVSPDGIITYSTNRKLDGTKLGYFPKGTRVTRNNGKKVLQSFVPVYWVLDPGHPRGYLGLDRDYGPVASQIRRTFLVQAGIITIAFLLLYLALLPIMHRLTARLKRALAERQQLAVIVETSNDAIVGCDPEGVITSWNAGAERVYGWKAEEVLGQPIDFVLPKARTPDEGIELEQVVHVRKNRRPVRVSMNVSTIRDESGELLGSSIIARDVTKMVEMEKELRHAQRQEAVARFATAVANELDGLMEGLVPTDAGVRGLELVRRLKDFGREDEPNPELVDLNAMLVGLGMRLELQLGDSIDFVLDPYSESATVYVDPARLQRVVLDLAISAGDAMPDGGQLVIRTEDVDFSRRTNNRDAILEAGHYVMLTVTDSSGSQHSDRMGLGLAAAFALVEQSGGTIGIESRPGAGTTVRLYLPRAENAAGVDLSGGVPQSPSVATTASAITLNGRPDA